MKTWLIAAVVAAGMAVALVPDSSEARRLGGGRPAGMQRATPDKAAQTQPAAPANQAAPNTANSPAAAAAPANAGAAAAAAAPRRSWLGPIAGLAAGLGLAALFSHLGLGEGLANFVMLALLVVVAVVALRWLLRRFAPGASKGAAYAMAGAGANAQRTAQPASPAMPPRQPTPAALTSPPIVVPSGTGVQPAAQPVLPADFDAAAFQRISKMIFIRMQAANDKADLNDLRAFTTPELYASLRLDLQERGSGTQQTDVVTLDADLLDFAQENDRQLVSVRFHGLIREESHSGAEPFDEVWHLVRPLDGGGASWAIAGIQPRH